MKVLVLGAGVVGTTSAWYLARVGHQVTVIDRQPIAGNETSFANGGQISVSHAEPWANPHALPHLFKWLGKENAPLLWRWRADPAQLAWGLRFLSECRPTQTRKNISAIVALALYSRQQLQALRSELALCYDQLERGILHIYTDPGEYAHAQKITAVMREFGLDRLTVDVEKCLEIEPALSDAQHLLIGGDFTATDESGDAHQFTRALADKAQAVGVEFRFNLTVDHINAAAGQVTGVQVSDPGGAALLKADAYVVALGSYAAQLLKPLGIDLPVYPAKGYSATLTLDEDANAPSVSLTDDERKIVFSRLGKRLRIAGTAEFNGYNLAINPVRCAALMQRTHELFPRLRTVGEPLFWCGLRPATPSSRPYIGRTRVNNLWLNIGHGTLGWTLACGSGAALADLISGKRPAADFPFIGC